MVIWNDNGAVTVGSNCENIQPFLIREDVLQKQKIT